MRRALYCLLIIGLWHSLSYAEPLPNLDRYIAQKDASYAWRIIDRKDITPQVAYIEMILTSQTWHGLDWHHRVKIYYPKNAASSSDAFLYITGGNWDDAREKEREANLRREREAPQTQSRPAGRRGPRLGLDESMIARQIAARLNSPFAILENVPLQPILGNKKEDSAIADTFNRYLETGEYDWPLLLPMAKSAVRAMDALQELARKEWKTELKGFVVGGASKRGWTTWLTAASDKRVIACAPTVIDVLNMPAQMKHQVEMLGHYSPMIMAYTMLGMQSKMETQRGQELLRIVDPYSYRERVTMPKMIILGTNDPYWTVDSLNLYWDGLLGEKYILYIPNKGHAAIDIPRLTANSAALMALATGKVKFPKMTWEYKNSAAGVTLNIKADKPAQRVWVFRSDNPTRNFTRATWQHEPAIDRDGGYAYDLTAPENGYSAIYGEGLFDLGDGLSVYLCTQIRVVGPKAPATTTAASLIPPKGKYDVRILRDTWGVPHIYGKTDADCAYGLGWAQCEDDWDTLLDTILLVRERLGATKGAEGAQFDYMMKLFRFREIVAARYATDLSPEARAICEAYADGCNHYAAVSGKTVEPGILPVTGQDIVTGFVAKSPFFFGLPGMIKKLMGKERPADLIPPLPAMDTNALDRRTPIGSNTFAIGPRRTPDGKTHLAVNSHQPWTGPVAWYEARLKSEQGYDIVGSCFPGSPVILHGHTPNLGWAHTVNHPDLADIYILEMNPENPMQYKFDGQWRDLEVRDAPVTVKLFGNQTMTMDQKARFSVYGPVIRQPHGAYAVRYAGYGHIKQVEQWYRMGKARNIAEFEQAMRIQGIASFNVGYADKEGNIWYIYNALFPKRAEGYDWSKFLPGNTSKTLWTEYLPFDKVPQVKNPKSGFVQNCNSSPFHTTIGDDNPKPEDFSKTLGIEAPSDMGNRALRLLELCGADESITEEEFYAYKYDMKYSRQSDAYKLTQKLLDMTPPDDPIAKQAIDVIRKWDFSTDPDNTGAAIAILTLEPFVRAQMEGRPVPDLARLLVDKSHLLQNTFGRLDVPWKQVNRLVRGKLELGLGGGPDIVHAIYGKWEKGRLVGMAGDSYILMVTWDKSGKVHSRSIHNFGSATLDESSPHYADQAPLFAARQTKPVWFDEAELRQHLEAEYRPGEKRPAPKTQPKP